MDLVPVTAKYTLPAFLMFLIATGVTSAEAVPYQIRPGGSNRLELTVEKTGLLSGKKHAFTFSRFEASLAFDRERLESSTVAISIESNSILCHDTWLSAKDLRKVQDYAQNDMLAGGEISPDQVPLCLNDKDGPKPLQSRGVFDYPRSDKASYRHGVAELGSRRSPVSGRKCNCPPYGFQPESTEGSTRNDRD